MIPFFSLRGMVDEYRARFTAAFDAELDAATFIHGQSVRLFEEEFAAVLGTADAVGVSNGLDALTLSLAALGIGAGDEVIVPTNSFIATALAVSSVGAKPVLVDCGPDHLIDPGLIGPVINNRTKAIIPVHLTGHPAEMEEICRIGDRCNLDIVEDVAQAHAARLHGKPCGTFGRAGCFSFYPTKNLGALGDGGIVITDDKALARRVRSLADYGKQDRDTCIERGSNKRLDSIQAAFLRETLRDLDGKNQERRRLAARYTERLAGCRGLGLPTVHDGCDPVWHLFIVRHQARDRLRDALQSAGIGTLIHYRLPIHLQPAYADLGHREGDFPVSEFLARTMLSLPFHPWLRTHEVDLILETVCRFCEIEAHDRVE